MEYSLILNKLSQLMSDEALGSMRGMVPVAVRYKRTCMTDGKEVIEQLSRQAIKQGWITWPQKVQRIESADKAPLTGLMPPLEAELVLENGDSLRLNYSDGRWDWLEISVQSVPHGEATALADRYYFQSREKTQKPLEYLRIWQYSSDVGLAIRDAVFTGFTEDAL